LGISADYYCLGWGVTTAVNAGSAGCCTFEGFRAFAARPSRTRLLALLNISNAGLAFAGLGGDKESAGELESVKLLDVKACVDCVRANRDMIVGVKIRLSDSIANEGRNEAEGFDRAIKAVAEAGVPLMVHHSFSTVSLGDRPGRMRSGNIYTHTYHGFPSTIIEPSSHEVDPDVQRAKEKGVLFDLGHGQGSFNWTVSELASRSAFWTHTISSDLHSGNCEGPAYDLPTVMSRLLHLGMPLHEVIRQATLSPAEAIGWDDRIGTLGVEREADVTVLSLDSVETELEDGQSQMRRIHQLLTSRAVWRAGTRFEITRPRQFPNWIMVESQRRWQNRLLIRDSSHSGIERIQSSTQALLKENEP